MATNLVQRAPTSVVQNGTASVHAIVPFREEVYSAQSVSTPAGIARALQQMQRHISEATIGTRSLPCLGGTYLPNQLFTFGTPRTFSHKVQGGQQIAWIALAPRASSTTLTVDLWLFERPGGQASTSALTLTGGIGVTEIAQNASRGTITLVVATVAASVARQAGIQACNASGAINDNVEIVECHTNFGAITLSLPTLANRKSNQVCGPLLIKDADGDAAANPVTVTGTVDGVSSLTISSNYGSVSLYAGSLQWWQL